MGMIIRAWRGRADSSNSRTYVDHFTQSVLPELRSIEGFMGASLLRQNRPDDVEFLVLTRWSSMNAIRTFAGADVQKAVVEPTAVAALISFDSTVQHYEVIEEVAAA
jgi:heme-degrading monooxygenase HmoA